jgi:oligopeptide/dipeptide ABC transporter ATP-binding protein
MLVPAMSAVLRVSDVVKHFEIGRGKGVVHAVDGVSLDVREGETLGLVGESGCGKTTLGRVIGRLYRPTSGTVHLGDACLSELEGEQLRRARRGFQMIFQDPYASLNPRLQVGAVLREPFLVHGLDDQIDVDERVRELLELVGLPAATAERWPRQLSGGQRQRVAIARALALSPRLIIADEPVSALDVSVQAQIVNLLEDVQDRERMALLFIGHDLSLVHHISDRIAVMYLGKIVETAASDALYAAPLHPYTRALLDAVPDADDRGALRRRTVVLQGEPPSPVNPPSGCRFRMRCPIARAECAAAEPPLAEVAPGRRVACFYPGEL